MVERSLSMREVPGSIPGASTILCHINIFVTLVIQQNVYRIMAQAITLLLLQPIWDLLWTKVVIRVGLRFSPRSISSPIHHIHQRLYVLH